MSNKINAPRNNQSRSNDKERNILWRHVGNFLINKIFCNFFEMLRWNAYNVTLMGAKIRSERIFESSLRLQQQRERLENYLLALNYSRFRPEDKVGKRDPNITNLNLIRPNFWTIFGAGNYIKLLLISIPQTQEWVLECERLFILSKGEFNMLLHLMFRLIYVIAVSNFFHHNHVILYRKILLYISVDI